jgi:GR25 family glycosyltransferase involved in LPS biosynthesis
MSAEIAPPVVAEDLDWLLLSAEGEPEKLAAFRKDHDSFELPLEVVPLTEAHEVDFRELRQIDLMNSDAYEWAPAEVGKAMTHWLAWHQAVESRRVTCIFQDDAILRRDFKSRLAGLLASMPAGWDMLQLGYDIQSAIDFQITPDCRFNGRFLRPFPTEYDLGNFVRLATPVVALRMFNVFGNFAYLVTPEGAQKLIDNCFPLSTKAVTIPALGGRVRTTNIDLVMNQHFGSMEAYVAFPPLALSRETGTSAPGASGQPAAGA